MQGHTLASRGSDRIRYSGIESRGLGPGLGIAAGWLTRGLAVASLLMVLLIGLERSVERIPPTEFGLRIPGDGAESVVSDREPAYVP